MSSGKSLWTAGLAAVTVAVAAVAVTLVVTRPASEIGGTALTVAAPARTASAPMSRQQAARSSGPSTVTTTKPLPTTKAPATKPPASTGAPAKTPAPATRTLTVTQIPAPTRSASESVERSTRSTTTRQTIEVSGDAALYSDTGDAVDAVERYWKYIFKGWKVTWHGPVLWAGDGFYDSASGLPGPTCNGERLKGNASFCGYGVVGAGVVSWDLQLMRLGYQTFGDSFVYLVVAHEWGHVAQERFEADGQEPAVLVQQELQADCLAGATLTKAAELGYLHIESGDTQELVASLMAMGDSHTWAGSTDHGSSDQRVAWFSKGFNGDIESCLGNR